ncbi:MAG TPA: hypothetical protein VFB72_07885, partial [Verrucomicrobiae bacterium]|nr:hypothetical protein [Verrucomicrobiae bacterium]
MKTVSFNKQDFQRSYTKLQNNVEARPHPDPLPQGEGEPFCSARTGNSLRGLERSDNELRRAFLCSLAEFNQAVIGTTTSKFSNHVETLSFSQGEKA